jgi:hypothetical protein
MSTVQKVNLTGKYKKPKDLSREECIKKLSREEDSNFYSNDDGMTIESLAANHFASSIDNSSYTDGIDSHFDNLTVTVCVDNPIVYELKLRVETCCDEDDTEMECMLKIAKGEAVNFDDYQGVMTKHVNIEALWNYQQNVIYISKNESDNSHELFKNFKNQPKIVSSEMFNCILAYS